MEKIENLKAMTANGNVNGTHVTDGPLTTSLIRENAPGLLRNDIDEKIVKIRPMSTPIDQISRMTGARKAKSMIVEYYSVDTKGQSASVTTEPKEWSGVRSDGRQAWELQTDSDGIFAQSDTLLVPEIKGYEGSNECGCLVLYVLGRGENNVGIRVIALNSTGPNLPAGTIQKGLSGKILVRMGRASAELAVQTPQFDALPKKANNYCQIFKTQVEQSSYARLSAKEVGWTLSDQEEVAIMDMRLGMEKSFLFGVKSRIDSEENSDEILFTGGIWNQAGDEIYYETLNQETIVDIMKDTFTGKHSGSSRKILLAGSNLISSLNKLDYTKVIQSGETVTKWGIDFSELRSKFGSLYVIHSEIFDMCNHSDDGLIIDPEYMVKYVHVPMKVERLDLRSSGVRNTDALVATEASCLTLRHPNAHLRLIKA
ncbi:MAG: DUF5309 family protein [Paramuribaculum sp.]|nr:DUF5309 family protein [Paramuribaculum sp.]